MRVIIELWLNNSYRGYRTISKQMYDNLIMKMKDKKSKLFKCDIEVRLVKEITN